MDDMTTLFDFIFEVEDQRDWQRRPGCARNSFSCFFCHMLRVVAPQVDEIHDITYGVGSFYEHCPSLKIYAADIRKWQWIVAPTEFKQSDALSYLKELPNDGRQRRVIVIDPPYPTQPASNSRNYEWLYFPKPWPFTYLNAVLREARAKSKVVVLKYMGDRREEAELTAAADYVITWRFVKSHIPANSGNVVVRNASKIFIFLG